MKTIKILSTLSFVMLVSSHASSNLVLIPLGDILIPILIEEPIEEFSEDITSMLSRNNEIRAEVFTGSELEWNVGIAASAQEHADYLGRNNLFEHSSSGYGENVYASSRDASYVDAVNSWYSEKSDFNVNTKTCNTGEQCGHYTQLIWKDTLEVGCGKSSSATWTTIVVCQYNPPGNYIGETPF